ncbi:MAG: ubiquinol-cytochrome c reductase iron-sulfur subunit [Cellulomonas sp.]
MSELDSYQDGATTGGAHSAESVAEPAGVSRRVVLRGVGTATLGLATVGVLAACSSDAGTTAATAPAAGPAADGVLAKVADIPVGGSIVTADADGNPIVLAQPTPDAVVGLSAVCTHQGCTVASDGAELVCPCHGSVYNSADGSTVSGPAPKPLPVVKIRVENGNVLLA